MFGGTLRKVVNQDKFIAALLQSSFSLLSAEYTVVCLVY